MHNKYFTIIGSQDAVYGFHNVKQPSFTKKFWFTVKGEACHSFYHYVPTADTACPYLYNQADFEEKFILL